MGRNTGGGAIKTSTAGDLVYVEWLDHISRDAGWCSVESLGDMAPARITSVGFILRETDKYLLLTHTIAMDGDVIDALMIIKSTIVARSTLQKPKRRRCLQ